MSVPPESRRPLAQAECPLGVKSGHVHALGDVRFTPE